MSPELSDRLRLILLLDACEAAGLTPIPVQRLHALAFLANVLSPIWSLSSYDGKILKRRGGPFYPELQKQLDRLVGLCLVSVSDVEYVEEDGHWRLDGAFILDSVKAADVIDTARLFKAEVDAMSFLRRLAFAVSRVARPLEELVRFDATWSDLRTGTGDVIDFSEWRSANYSAFSISAFTKFAPLGLPATRGDKIQLYMRFLEKRAHGAG
jgi:hypothetical protein